MNCRYCIVFLIILIQGFNAFTQVRDSMRAKQIIHRSILPAALIGAGLVVNNSQFEQNLKTNLRAKVDEDFNLHIDDYLQYIPIAELYIADIFLIVKEEKP